MNLKNKPQAKVYIDGSNIFYTQKQIGWSIDWAKAKKILQENYNVLEIRYYTGLKEGDKKMDRYLKYLRTINFTIITKPLKKIKLRNTKNSLKTSKTPFIYKANFDVEIAVDILLDKSKLTKIILFSGDSDFSYLIKKLKKSGKRVIIFSSRKTLSWELKLVASELHYLEDLKNKIGRK